MTNGANIFARLSLHLDYLQRSGESFELPPLGPTGSTPASTRQVVPVRSVGRVAKPSATEARQAAQSDWQLTQYAKEAFVIGLHENNYPIAFLLHGTGGRTSISFGLWSRPGSLRLPSLDQTTEIFQSLLDGAYPGTEIGSAEAAMATGASRLKVAGLVRGVPTPKPADASGALAVDRLIRAMGGLEWQVCVLAEPCTERFTRELRGRLLGEMRSIDSTAQVSSPNPLATHYNELQKAHLEALSEAQGVGAWRVGVYLLGTGQSYTRLAGGWRGIFAGEQSIPEPVRVSQFNDAAMLAADWDLPDDREQPNPSGYENGYNHPFKYQTILSSSQLAAYVHLPQLETAGFSVKVTPDFDTVPPVVRPDKAFRIGDVVNRGGIAKIVRLREEEEANAGKKLVAEVKPKAVEPKVAYSVEKESLEKHIFVTGMTGSGKTNAIVHLLQEAMRARIPFLILEPAKTEYRKLLHDELAGPVLQVFTVGAEWGSPLRLNPFEIMPGVSVSLHLDLLRSVFSASFGMWVPMPQVLERSLYAVYEDRGWDLVKRLQADTQGQAAFPTLTDLIYKVREIVPQLGFDPEAQGRVLGSLVTRLDGLRTGPKGRMYDVPRSVDMKTLLDFPTLLELDALGDDDDKAFFMGLLFIRLVEHRRVCDELGLENQAHLLVIEEAHRLLTNVPRSTNDMQADPRGKAVETFTNLISEIRSYHQGVIVADQVPTRLAPDVIKNTNLKIAHRVVAGDDREVLGKAMSMNEQQMEALGSLPDRVAAVFSGGNDDAPLLVELDFVLKALSDKIKRDGSPKIPLDSTVRESMRSLRSLEESDWRFFRIPECESHCLMGSADSAGLLDTVSATDGECQAAKKALDSTICRKALIRLVLTVMENDGPIDALGENLRTAVLTQTPDGTEPDQVYHCFRVRAGGWIADHWGAQRRWSAFEIERFAIAVRAVLLTLPPESNQDRAWEVAVLRDTAADLHRRTSPPYAFCEKICNQSRPFENHCLYRYPVREMLQSSPFPDGINATKSDDGNGLDAKRLEDHVSGPVWQLLAKYERLDDEHNGEDKTVRKSLKDAIVRAQLCFVQQAIADDPQIHPWDAEKWMGQIVHKWQVDPLATDPDGTMARPEEK